jgi:2'-5' RNA ligase
MVDRWADPAGAAAGDNAVYWHMLLGDHAEVRHLAALARMRLAGFGGLHFTPDEWLHITTVAAGPREKFSDPQLAEIAETAAEMLSGLEPVTVNLGKILYHPQAIMLAVHPAKALEPVRAAVARATGPAATKGVTSPWIPHATIAYSTASQPAGPLIGALGTELPSRTMTIKSVSLVIQRGPEQSWDWEPVNTVEFSSTKANDAGQDR